MRHYNHEIWTTCAACGKEYDLRVGCDTCKIYHQPKTTRTVKGNLLMIPGLIVSASPGAGPQQMDKATANMLMAGIAIYFLLLVGVVALGALRLRRKRRVEAAQIEPKNYWEDPEFIATWKMQLGNMTAQEVADAFGTAADEGKHEAKAVLDYLRGYTPIIEDYEKECYGY